MKRLSPIFLALCVLVTAIVLLTPTVPLGVTGVNADGSPAVEWVWQRHRTVDGVADALERMLPAALAGALLFGVSRFGTPGTNSVRTTTARPASAQPTSAQTDSVGRWRAAARYVALIAAAWLWGQQLQQTAPMEHRETKPLWVLYDPSSSGYFFEAAFHMDSTAEFLAGYEARMQQGEVLHVGTHPPGLFLLSKGCLTLCEASPTLVSWLFSVQDVRQREAFRLLESQTRFAPPLTTPQLAALQLLSGFTNLAVALTIIPLAFLSHLLLTRSIAWHLSCLWATFPCLAVFSPKSDVLFALTSTTVLACGMAAMVSSSRRPVCRAVVAGGVLWLGLMLSLAHLPVVVLLIGFAAVRAIGNGRTTLQGDAIVLSTLAGTVLLLTVVFQWLTHCNLFAVWSWNLTNHAGFYDQFTRTWWKWLLVNPIELAFSTGLPVFALAIAGMISCLRHVRQKPSEAGHAFCTAALITLLALWLSGKNQGEAARLWCFLTPWLLIAAGWYQTSSLASESPVSPVVAPQSSRGSLTAADRLLIAQIAISILTVSHVSGFSF
ncbi:MAG: hypothetical protein R3C59_11230 [Planctomycetaceae bacterium]